MQVYRELKDLPEFANTVLTIGSFDGVHAGHQKILKRVKEIASLKQSLSIVVTFHPHPRSVVYPKDDSLKLLNSLEEKIELIESFGIDVLVIVPFTIEFSQLSAQEYIENFLITHFKPSELVIGYDHRFGLNRVGDIQLLKLKSKALGFEVTEIPKQEIDLLTISSTKIRNSVSEGHLEEANVLLKQPYRLSGKVIRGRKLGTEIGFPTANIEIESELKLIPKKGIYVVYVAVNDEEYRGMLYIGDIPTIGTDNPLSIEVNIFDFNQDIYDTRISVKVLKYLRGDMKFNDLASLKVQLGKDREMSLAYFSHEDPTIDTDATVAILNYNTVNHLENYLPSTSFSSKNSFSTVVIDNASNDGSQAYISEWHPEIELVQLDKNYGFAGGYNQGLKNVQSKYIALLNSDVQVSENWLDPLVEFLDGHPGYGAVMPKIRSFNEKEYFEYAGASGGYLDFLGYPFCRGRIFDFLEKDDNQYDSQESIFWVTGAACLIRTELFKKLGGFDEDYFAHQEEIDLCWRMHRAGYKLGVVPSSTVFHLGGGTLDYGNSRKVYLNFRNNLFTLFKNLTIPKLLWVIPLRLILDGIAGVKFLFGANIRSVLSIIKAHIHFYLALVSLIKKRKRYSEKILAVKVGEENLDGMVEKSILFEYFVKGNKTFSKIFS